MYLHLQLCEENVLFRVVIQAGEDLERRWEKGGREGKKGGRREFRKSFCPYSLRGSTHPPAHAGF